MSEPSAEALAQAEALRCTASIGHCRRCEQAYEMGQPPPNGHPAYFPDSPYPIARSLDAFATQAVQQERERCAQIAHNARSEAELERHNAVDREGKACWLWAFDTANAIERDIRAGQEP